MINQIIKFHFSSLKRFQTSKYQFAPEYIALFLVISLFTIIILGISSEDALNFSKKKIINFNYLSIFIFVGPIFLDSFTNKSYSPNYQYLKILFPYKIAQIIFIDIIFEMFSYKLIFIFFFIIMYFPFCIVYDLIIFGIPSIFGFVLILIMYLNSCLTIRVLKDIMKDKVFIFHKNYLKLFILIFIILFVINENINFLKLDEINSIFLFFEIAILLAIILVVTLYLINIKYDKI